MKLSIVTINYNDVTGLKKTMDSVVTQSFTDFEWIVIDGGSTDGSKELIDKISKEHIAYWCCEHDKGIYNAMNKGLMHCKGDYVCFLNSGDMFFNSNVLKNIFGITQTAQVLYGDAVFIYTEGGGSSEILRNYPDKVTLSWLYHDTLNHQATFVKRDVLKCFGFDETYTIMADRKLWLQIKLAGYSFKHISLPIVRYDHSGISATNGETWLRELNDLRSEIIPWYLKSRITRKMFSIIKG